MFDLIVLGGGPAGVTAALRARELGARTALVERDNLGGTCTNDGCVPTRVLARAARFMRDARRFADYGLVLESQPEVDFEQIIRRTQHIVYQIHEKKQLLDHLRGVQVEVYDDVGPAHFLDPHRIQLEDGTVLESQRFVLCVGGHPRRLPVPGAEYTLTHSDVWTLNKLPTSAVIVGSGATGCQFASILNAFGTQVTLMDIAPRILIAEDELVSQTMAAEFRQNGIEIITGIDGINRIDRRDSSLDLFCQHNGVERMVTAEAVILSVGWPGNIEGLHLEAAGVEVERSYIKVNDALQTTAPHIYAAGDITGRMMLVQSASREARIAVENALLDGERRVAHSLVPHGGFTDPEYGSVGPTEQQARERYDVMTAVIPYADLDRAVIDGVPEGFCKLLIDRQTRLIIGAHVVGEQALEIVQMVATGMAGGLRVEQLAELEIAYPTLAAIVGLAARQIVRELGIVPVVQEWRTLKLLRGAEWERQTEG
ncbi:MAG: NAD(P)/FAD-dependent oxidoreductase [Chloroflexi bacterium]|nr:NAD(P)/FAD-dependent oxidoreductase [Chloroflexota bacterium]